MMDNLMKKYLLPRGRGALIFSLALAAFSLVLLLPMAGVACAAEKQQSRATQIKFLEGRWIRPDGGYILDLSNINKDGQVSAAYFNPRPIRVHRSEISRKDGKITLVVELRDLNYPGSTYTLQYDAASDRLKGTYYQAVHRQTFDVEFVRTR